MAFAAAEPEARPDREKAPTPIATGRGIRSAAVDDRALSDFLEATLKVPDLTLPQFHQHRSISSLPSIDLRLGIGAETEAVRRLAAEGGAFGVEGSGVSAEEVVSVIEMAGGRVFGTSDGDGDGGSGRRRGAWNELCWYHPMRPEDGSALEMLLSDSYPSLRKKLEDISLRLEEIGDLIMGVLLEQIKKHHGLRTDVFHESLLRLRKYDHHHLINGNASLEESCKTVDHTSHALSLHLSLKEQEFCIRSQECSTYFLVPRGLLIVTLGKLVQEWSNDKFKHATCETPIEPSHDPDPLFTLEYVYSPKTTYPRQSNSLRSISVVDQILVVFALAFLYKICTYLYSKFFYT